jgi:hypothetical protein
MRSPAADLAPLVRSRSQRGQVLPLVALVVALTGVACLVVGQLASMAVDRAHAQTAADAAALAGAAAGERAARDAAAANRAGLLRFSQTGPEARVVVRFGAARASARARRMGEETNGLAPALRAALARAEALLGEPVPAIPAPVGSSPPRGRPAVEVPTAVAERLAAVAERAGLCRPEPRTQPERFEVCGPGRPGEAG